MSETEIALTSRPGAWKLPKQAPTKQLAAVTRIDEEVADRYRRMRLAPDDPF